MQNVFLLTELREGVNLQGFERSIKSIGKALEDRRASREKVLVGTREITNIVADAIVKIHTGRIKEVKDDIKKAGTLLQQLQAGTDPELKHYLLPVQAEYVEAKGLHHLIEKRNLPSYRELGVEGTSYLMGMLDLIGEIKRHVYSMIREGRSDDALHLFDAMERLYLLLSPFAIYDNTIKGIRRKLDVDRVLVEDTRAAVIEEVRRRDFLRHMDSSLSTLKDNKGSGKKIGETRT